MRSHEKAPFAGSVWTAGATALVCAVALLALTASSASAALGNPVVRTFSTGPNTFPRSLATDADGNVYVFEQNASRVDKFDPSGNRLPFSATLGYVGESSLTGNAKRAFQFPEINLNPSPQVAVDTSGGPTDGYIYVGFVNVEQEGQSFPSETAVYGPDGVFKGSMSHGCGVAVNPADGSVFLNLGNVRRYPAPTGKPEAAVPNGELQVGNNCEGVRGLAADSAGAVYKTNPARKYDPSQFGLSNPTFTDFGLNASAVAIDQSNGDVYADVGAQVVRFNSAGAQVGTPFGSLSGSEGLALAPNGEILATDSAGGVFVFGQGQVDLPTATTGGVSNVTATSADVEGAVDPDGAGNITGCLVRYGEDSGYSTGSAPCNPGAPISSSTNVTAHLTGLTSNATYRYRVFVTNANGTQMAFSEQSFTTTPALAQVSTGAATGVTKNSADLHGSFEGDGTEAHYYFEWGATTAYGHTTPVPPGASAGSGTGNQSVAPIHISGLHASTKYHYRLVVSTPGGVTRGQDETLTTSTAVANLTAEIPTTATETTADLRASFTGDGTYETSYYFEWGPTTEYGNVTPVPPGNSVPASSGKVSLPPVQISGLSPSALYHFRVVASNATGTSMSGDVTFETEGSAPLVRNLRSRNVLANSAEVLGEINPRYSETTYRFEWGESTSYGNVSPAQGVSIDSGGAPLPVSVQLQGLAPDVTYHFRLVASNEHGTTASPDQTFGFYPPSCPNAQLRQETRSSNLPDCRAIELVTPSYAQGTFIYPTGGPAAPLASSPSRLAYSGSSGTFSEDVGDPSNVNDDLYVSTRTDTGWVQRFVGRPASETFQMGGPPKSQLVTFWNPGNLNLGLTYLGAQASADLSRVVSYDRGRSESWLSKDEQGNPYVLGNWSNAPYVWDTDTSKLIERWPTNLAGVPGGEKFIGVPRASADFSHFVFESNVVFAAGGNAVDREINASWEPAASIYDNDVRTGAVELASIKGDDQTDFEGHVLDVSGDGSRILMSEESAIATYLGDGTSMPREHMADVTGPFYLRVDGEHTWEIGGAHEITWVGSTADGKTIYLTSSEQLTADDHDQSRDLFAWNESSPSTLTRVSKGNFGEAGNEDDCGATWSGGGCSVQTVDFSVYSGWRSSVYPGFGRGQGGNGYSDNTIASQGGDIYFLSPDELIQGRGKKGQANLYLYRKGVLKFVTALSPKPACTYLEFVGSCANGAIARMQVTPSGDHMAFVVTSKVGDYDNAGFTEMYTYDPETGQLICTSCRPDGKPPTSSVLASQNGLFQTYDGRVFFTTRDPLVPRDTNDSEDVYEFTEGKAQLISSGLGQALAPRGIGAIAGFVSVSANGTDAYFASTENLVTQDHNGGSTKIYDARTGGGFPAERTPEKCAAADECHGAGVSPPALPADRTGANLGKKAKQKAHKTKKHKKRAHKKKKAKKAKSRKSNGKQGRSHRG